MLHLNIVRLLKILALTAPGNSSL